MSSIATTTITKPVFEAEDRSQALSIASKLDWTDVDYTVITTGFTDRLVEVREFEDYDLADEYGVDDEDFITRYGILSSWLSRYDEFEPAVVFNFEDMCDYEEKVHYIDDDDAFEIIAPLIQEQGSVVFESKGRDIENFGEYIDMLEKLSYCVNCNSDSIISVKGYEVDGKKILVVKIDCEFK